MQKTDRLHNFILIFSFDCDHCPFDSFLDGEAPKYHQKKEKYSTGSGTSPPEVDKSKNPTSRLVTPVRDVSTEQTRRHDMAVGPSPPKEIQNLSSNGITDMKNSQSELPVRHSVSVGPSPPRENARASVARTPPEPPVRHTISVGPSPPREQDLRPSTPRISQKKSTGTSPPRRILETRGSSVSSRTNTGTSPPPQSISTQVSLTLPIKEMKCFS